MISIVIPLFNVERYIESCLRSFENQKYKDFEIIIVNDGSQDNSVAIVENIIKKSKIKIKLLHQKNSGVSAARNTGIINAQGEFICFVDADDMVTPEYLSKMFYEINRNNHDIVICDYEYVNEDCACNFINSANNHFQKISSSEALEKYLYRDISPGIWSIMIRTSLIKENKLFFSEGFRYSEDIEFIFKIMSYSRSIGITNDRLYLYRIRNGSAMSLVDDKRLDGFELMQRLEVFFDNENTEFALKFRKFGVARWVWATIWQIAISSEKYNDFITNVRTYNPKLYIRRLVTFPKIKVAISSLIFNFCPYIYYKIIRKLGLKRLNGRKILRNG